MLLILVASFVVCFGGVTVDSIGTKFKQLTNNNVQPGFAGNVLQTPYNDAGHTIDQNYWVSVSATTGTCAGTFDPFACSGIEVWSQQIVPDPVLSNNKKLSNAAGTNENVILAAQSAGQTYILYMQKGPNATFPSSTAVSGWTRRPDGSGTAAVRVTPPIPAGAASNAFLPGASDSGFHIVGFTQVVDDKIALNWPTAGNLTFSYIQEVYITRLDGSAGTGGNPWFKISPAVSQVDTAKSAKIYSTCQNRIIFQATPSVATQLYISEWQEAAAVQLTLAGNTQNATTSSASEQLWWSSNGNYFALLWRNFFQFGLYFGNAQTNTMFSSGAKIGPAQNDTSGQITGWGWTPNGQYFLFSAVDAANFGNNDLYAYDPLVGGNPLKLTAFTSNINSVTGVKAQGNYVVFSTSGDANTNAQLFSWVVGTSAATTNIGPTVIPNNFPSNSEAKMAPSGAFQITTDTSRVAVVAYSANFTANFFSCAIGSNSCFQMNSPHSTTVDGATFSSFQFDISRTQYGTVDWFVYKFRSGFLTTINTPQYSVESSSSAVQGRFAMHSAPSTAILASQTQYSYSMPVYSQSSVPMFNFPVGCSATTLTNTWWTNAGKIAQVAGQNYVFSQVDTTSDSSNANGNNRLFVNSVDNSLGIKSLSPAAVVNKVPFSPMALVHPTQNYVSFRQAIARADGAVGAVDQYQYYFSHIPTFEAGRQLGPDFNTSTLITVDAGLRYTNAATNKAVFFVTQSNCTFACDGSTYNARKLYFATFTSATTRTLFDATPNTQVAVTDAATDPLFPVSNINTISNGDVIYFQAKLPNNAAASNNGIVAISPNGGTYGIAFPQTGTFLKYGALENKYQAIALANISGSATQFNGFVNTAMSSTIAPLFILVAMFVALF